MNNASSVVYHQTRFGGIRRPVPFRMPYAANQPKGNIMKRSRLVRLFKAAVAARQTPITDYTPQHDRYEATCPRTRTTATLHVTTDMVEIAQWHNGHTPDNIGEYVYMACNGCNGMHRYTKHTVKTWDTKHG